MNIKNAFRAITAIAAVMLIGPAVQAQPPQGGHGGGQHGGPPPGGHPIVAAIDVDQNHEISAEEIDNATKALKALDKNGDGKLNEEDLGKMGPPGGGRGGGHGPGHGGGPGGRDGAGADEGEMMSDFTKRILAFDRNEDGKVEKKELPSRMKKIVEQLDKNNDNALDRAELESKDNESGEGSARGQRGGRDGARGERGGRGGERGGRGGRGGGGQMERVIDHAFEFDKDGDGLLSREELTEFAKNMPQGGGPPGGGPPRGGRGR